jgi:hypothetical protein
MRRVVEDYNTALQQRFLYACGGRDALHWTLDDL